MGIAYLHKLRYTQLDVSYLCHHCVQEIIYLYSTGRTCGTPSLELSLISYDFLSFCIVLALTKSLLCLVVVPAVHQSDSENYQSCSKWVITLWSYCTVLIIKLTSKIRWMLYLTYISWFAEYVLFLGCITSLLSLAWGVTAYARGSRFTDHEKDNISLLGTVVLFLWHIFSIGMWI